MQAKPPLIGAMTTTGTHLRLVRDDELPAVPEQPYVRVMSGPGLDRVSSTIEALIALPHHGAERRRTPRSGRGRSR